MNSEPEDTKSQLTQNQETPTKKKKKKHRAPPTPLPLPLPPVQGKAKVQVLHGNPQKAPPFVGYFSSSYDPCKDYSGNNSEGPDGIGSPRVRAYRSQKWPKRVQMVVSPSQSRVDFVGTNYSGEATIGQRYKYALGVFDKESQSLKIVPVACDRVSLLFGC
jgi:DNA-directed RNA polymerase I subunit RPA49